MRSTTLTAALLATLVARAAAGVTVPERICDPGDVAPRARCRSPDYVSQEYWCDPGTGGSGIRSLLTVVCCTQEALEFSRENGDRFHQCCERYGTYLARIEHVSIEELENTIRQW